MQTLDAARSNDAATPTPTRRRRRRAVAALALAIGIPMVSAVPEPAAAATVAQYRVRGTGGSGLSARTRPVVAPGSTHGAVEGAVLNVQCQVLGEPFGPRGNTLYFVVNQGGRTFYAPDYYTDSPHLAGQPPIAGIPMCSSVPAPTSNRASRVASWARSKVGQVYATGADASSYRDWAPGPYGEWSGDCIKFAQRAWASVGITVPRGNAIDVYRTYQSQGKIRTVGVPPAGALVFWNATSWGHVAVSVGGNQVIGTRGLDGARRPIAQYSISSIGGYLGWVLPA